MRTRGRHPIVLWIAFFCAAGTLAWSGEAACWIQHAPRLPRRVFFDPPGFAAFVGAVRAQPFPDGRLALVRRAADLHWLTCAQIVSLLPLFEWSEDRVSAVEVSAPAIADPPNVGSILAMFESYDGLDRGRVRAALGLSDE